MAVLSHEYLGVVIYDPTLQDRVRSEKDVILYICREERLGTFDKDAVRKFLRPLSY
jgi:hypothetical protein